MPLHHANAKGHARESSAGVSPARCASNESGISIRNRGHLPHWEAAAAIYFVTFRLADSLPQEVLHKIEVEIRDVRSTAAQMGRDLSDVEQRRLISLQARRVEGYLDTGAGACSLRSDAVAQVVVDALQHFEGDRYELYAWCVMPNHVHVVFKPLERYRLAEIVHSWKSFSAKRANGVLNRSGEFWQREYFDRLIRDRKEFSRIVSYVLDNPKRARLKDWRWVWPTRDA